jgi:hypothetical protein
LWILLAAAVVGGTIGFLPAAPWWSSALSALGAPEALRLWWARPEVLFAQAILGAMVIVSGIFWVAAQAAGGWRLELRKMTPARARARFRSDIAAAIALLGSRDARKREAACDAIEEIFEFHIGHGGRGPIAEEFAAYEREIRDAMTGLIDVAVAGREPAVIAASLNALVAAVFCAQAAKLVDGKGSPPTSIAIRAPATLTRRSPCWRAPAMRTTARPWQGCCSIRARKSAPWPRRSSTRSTGTSTPPPAGRRLLAQQIIEDDNRLQGATHETILEAAEQNRAAQGDPQGQAQASAGAGRMTQPPPF